jgi:hypothetical protein
MNPDYSLADWVSNRGTLGARKPLRAPGPIWGGSHCRPKLNLSVARFSGLWVSSVRAKFAHSTLFGGRKKAHILQFVGFSVWHPDCDSVLRYLNGNSSTLTFWVPR